MIEFVFEPNDFFSSQCCSGGRAISDQALEKKDEEKKKKESQFPAYRIVMRQGSGRVTGIKWIGNVLAWIYIPTRQVQLKIWITWGLGRVFLMMQFKHMSPCGTAQHQSLTRHQTISAMLM